ncbi:MAG: hypothetical protein ACLQOO_12155 [Terriglobia bacterium]
MAERRAEQERFSWQLPLYAVVGASVVLLSLFVCNADASLLYLLFIVPIFSLSCLVLLVIAAIRKKPRRCLSMFLTVVAFLAVSGTMLKERGTLRPRLRWLIWSHRYKAELLATPDSPKGELKHIEWDGWGWGPVGPTIIYLVYDSTDSLSAAAKSHKPGHLSGIPCEVSGVQRLESHWYAVTFYTEESWGKRNRLDCSGSGT